LAAFVHLTNWFQNNVGGTWLANHYPGLSCDVPIHIYTLPFNPKHDWKTFLATGLEIKQYIQETSAKFGLDKYMQFNSRVTSAIWDEASGKWHLTGKSPASRRFTLADTNEVESNEVISHDECDILIGASGTQRQAVYIGINI
jgi:cation diffusion facilitator CzcD-associated flavoprotein CzcO